MTNFPLRQANQEAGWQSRQKPSWPLLHKGCDYALLAGLNACVKIFQALKDGKQAIIASFQDVSHKMSDNYESVVGGFWVVSVSSSQSTFLPKRFFGGGAADCT
jgi:hypothetical protein